MNLYEISTQYLATAQQLAELDIDEQTLSDTLEAEAWPVEEKVRAVSAVILNLQAEADMVKGTADRIAKRAKALQSRADALHDYLLINMQRTGITEIKALDGTFKAKLYRERDANVIIDSEHLIPADYMREIPARQEPDKVLIKKAIKDGYEVPGAHVVKKDRLEIKA
jgi:hypothetical protein